MRPSRFRMWRRLPGWVRSEFTIYKHETVCQSVRSDEAGDLTKRVQLARRRSGQALLRYNGILLPESRRFTNQFADPSSGSFYLIIASSPLRISLGGGGTD